MATTSIGSYSSHASSHEQGCAGARKLQDTPVGEGNHRKPVIKLRGSFQSVDAKMLFSVTNNGGTIYSRSIAASLRKSMQNSDVRGEIGGFVIGYSPTAVAGVGMGVGMNVGQCDGT